MKRKVLLLALIGTLLIQMTGCSSNKTKEIDGEALAQYFIDHIEFEDELSAIDASMNDRMYEIPEDVTGIVYVGSGATSEEIAVFTAKTPEDADLMLTAANQHIEDQKESYANYLPLEAAKLENAFVKEYGNYVIVVVSPENDVNTIFKEYIKES